MDSGAVKTILPRDAIPGMRIKKKSGGKFRVANGTLINNLGETKIKGTGTVSGSQVEITSQVADVTKPLASATEMADQGNLVVLHKTGGIVKKLDPETVKQIRDIIKKQPGPELILERRGGTFMLDVDVKSEGEQINDKWMSKKEAPKRFTKSNNTQSNQMDVDMAGRSSNRFGALWSDEPEIEELECQTCNQCFHRP